MLSESLSPKAQAQALAEFAREQIEEARQENRQSLGHDPRYTVSVDGREGAALTTVSPDGIIIAEFELVGDVLNWIGQQLQIHAPEKTGKYKHSFVVFVEDSGKRYIFTNLQPYSGKIERGSSSQAPDGVFHAVAVLGQSRFGNIAHIEFSYHAVVGGEPVSQELAHSFGGWFFGNFYEARAASGVRESRIAKKFGKTAHNVSSNRFPCIIVTIGK
jgi:hypothetical protein